MSACKAAWCCFRSESTNSGPASASPVCARVAEAIRRLVTPLIADTTTTIEASRAPSTTILAERAMHSASPIEVPPNFMTRSGFAISNAPGQHWIQAAGSGQHLGIQNGSTRGSANGVVAERDETEVQHLVGTKAPDGYAHSTACIAV